MAAGLALALGLGALFGALGVRRLAHRAPIDRGVEAVSEVEAAANLRALDSAEKRVAAAATPARGALALPRTPAPALELQPTEELAGAPVRGRLVDRALGLPLADVEVRVRGTEELGETVSTDADGRFATEERYAFGAVALVVDDFWLDAELRVAHDHAPGGEPVHALDLGELYRLEFDPPPGLERADFLARIAVDEDGGSACMTWLSEVDPTVVRFGRTACPRAALPWLQLESADGMWAGAALRPAHGGLVRVVLEPRGKLAGVVRRSDGGPASDLDLVLVDAAGVERDRARTGDAGGFAFGRVAPGRYAVRTRSAAYAPESAAADVVAGARSELALLVEPRAIAGELAGTVTTASGDAVGATARLELDGERRTARVEWTSAAGAAVGRFAFADVPEGPARLGLDTAARFDVAPAELPVRAPDAGLAFRIDDRAPLVAVECVARDAASGARLEAFTLTVLDARGRALGYFSPPWDAKPLRVRADRGLAWIVAAEGYAPARGTVASSAAARADSALVVEAALEREPDTGRGLRLVRVIGDAKSNARGDDGAGGGAGGGLAGAAVELDGRALGVTDELGVLVLRAPWPPERWTVTLAGWTLERVSWERAVARRVQHVLMIRQEGAGGGGPP